MRRMRRARRMRAVNLSVCAALVALSASAARAAGVWDFFGSVGVSAGRTDNPTLASAGHLRSICDLSSPNYDPNMPPICDPNNPSRFTPARHRSGEVTGTLRLTGGVTAAWERSGFDLAYSPTGLFYQDRSYLDQVSHDLTSSWRHSYTPRTSLNLSEQLNYTPEQDLDPNAAQLTSLLTRRTSRLTSGFQGNLGVQHSATSGLTYTYRNAVRSFSSPEFIDTVDHHAGVHWKRRVGRHSSINSGYEYGIFEFGSVPSDPNSANAGRNLGSDHHQANVGYGFESARGLHLNVSAGYNVLLPDDPDLHRSSGLYADTSVGWSGPRLVASGGYNRGISDGGGAYTNSQNENLYSNLRWTVSRKVSADLTAARSVNERLNSSSPSVTSSDVIRTFNGRATVTYSVAKNLGMNASFTHYRQALPNATTSVPEVRSNRYSIGLTWSIR